jgi:ketosteroid isomerase-like protein
MSERNSDIVRRGYEAFGRGDLGGLLATYDDNIDWITPGPPELATAGHRRGAKAVGEFFMLLGGMFEFQKFAPHTFVEEGDHVVVLGDEIVKVKATGKLIEGGWVHAFTFKNGKVVAFQEYFDTAAVLAALRA